jgi:hypothetical protein
MINNGLSWSVLLYNFNTGAWEIQYQTSDKQSIDRADGWDVFEKYFSDTCISVPKITSNNLMILENGVWSNVDSSHAGPWNYDTCNYIKTMVYPFYQWSVVSPALPVPPTTPNNIVVTSPNGGEQWRKGTSHQITWLIKGNTGTSVKIELLQGTSVNRVITSSVSNSGKYSWNIPSAQSIGDYKIRVTSKMNASVKDDSDNIFKIVR